MKHKYLALLALALAPIWGPATRAGAQTPVNSYDYVALTQFGGPYTSAIGLNDAGHVVGTYIAPGGSSHAFLWRDGVLRDLGTLGGPVSVPHSVNTYDQVVGWSYTAGGQQHAFFWDPASGMRDLGTFGGSWSLAQSINDAGQVVGTSVNAAGTSRAFLWQNGQLLDLGVPDAYSDSHAEGINVSGQIVGGMTLSNGEQAFLWTPTAPNGTTGSYRWLDSYAGNWANGINGAGTAVGGQQNWDWMTLPMLWDVDSSQTLAYSVGGEAYAINDSRVAVGYNAYDDGFGGYSQTAFVWDDVNGGRDLNALAGFDWVPMSAAYGINSSGQIVAGSYLLTPSPKPSRPWGLAAAMVNGKVYLTWVGSSGADYYHVKRSSTSGGPYTTIADAPGISFTDPTTPSGNVYYIVTAVNAYGESADSNEAYPVLPPVAPTGLTAAAGDRLVNLSWNASSGADLYHVYRSKSNGGPYEEVSAVSGTSYTNVGLTNGTTYYYVVVAENWGGQSGFSNQASATPIAPPSPAPPTILTAVTAKGKKRIDLTWKQSVSAGVTQNRVYRSTTPGGPYSLRATLSAGTKYSDTSVTSGATYYYVVTAVNSTGKESLYSNQTSAKAR